jgi:hypothetical protein
MSQRRKKPKRQRFDVPLFAVSFAISAGCIYWCETHREAPEKSWTLATGKVVATKSVSTGTTRATKINGADAGILPVMREIYKIRYSIRGQRDKEVWTNAGFRPNVSKEGDTVQIRYDPKDPNNVVAEGQWSVSFGLFWFLAYVVGIVFGIGSVALIVFPFLTPPPRPEEL